MSVDNSQNNYQADGQINELPGKFIVLYGINNLGKTTQAKMLVEKIRYCGLEAEYIKYPIYDLSPSGPVLNDYLRLGNTKKLTPKEAQIIYTLNRSQYESTLKEKLAKGIHVVAEDYAGTGIAWGMGAGVEEKFLKQINSHLLKENLAFLFDGERFLNSAENGHLHETDADLINKVRRMHLKLAEEFNWIKIDANLNLTQIHEKIWNYFLKTLMQSAFDKKVVNDFMAQNQPKFSIKKLTADAKIPERNDNSGSYSLYSAEYASLNPGETTAIKTGLKIILPKNCLGLVYDNPNDRDIEVNTKIIDANFTREIILTVLNIGQDILHIAPNQPIAQLIVQCGGSLIMKNSADL